MASRDKRSQRFTDAGNESLQTPTLKLRGLKDTPLLGVVDAVKCLTSILPSIESQARRSLQEVQSKTLSTGVSADGLASIRLYTMEPNGENSLYREMNNRLRERKSAESLKPFYRIIKLMLTALSQLNVYSGTVYRGITFNIESYRGKVGKDITWNAFSSCSSRCSNARDFLQGQGTIIEINGARGFDISSYSCFDEGEVLLVPETRLRVDCISPRGDGCVLTQISEPKAVINNLLSQ